MKVAVVGLGKAGLPLAAVIADAGIDVVGIDVNPKRVAEINAGKNPIPEEPELGDILKRCGGSRLKAASDYSAAAECTAFIVIVPLFIDEDKKPDYSIIEAAFGRLAGIIKDEDLVVMETTLPPGTTETLLKGLLDKSGKKYHLAYSPERIMTGYSISRYREFPKVVGGVDAASGDMAFLFYSKFCKAVKKVSDAKTAEMVKVAEGLYRDVNIALANELLKVCEKMGVDYYEVREMAKHKYCDLHLPGNVGGHCIPVYPWFLINDYDVPLIRMARQLNDDMIVYFADKVRTIAPAGKVLVVGVSFREGVKETAYTRSIPFIRLLESRGYAVYVYDPMFTRAEIEAMNLKHMDISGHPGVDVVVLMDKYDGIILPDIDVLRTKR